MSKPSGAGRDFHTDVDVPSNMHGTLMAREVWESSCHKCKWVSAPHDMYSDSLADLAAHTRENHEGEGPFYD